MKVARLVVLGVAIVAGFLAWRLASSIGSGNNAPVVVEKAVDTDKVLVAKTDIVPGAKLTAADLQWEEWPRNNVSDSFVTEAAEPDAIKDLEGAVARTSFFSGEPIRDAKLVKAGAGGFLAAMLPPGKRAMATEISPENGAGGFILPNDHVDVVLTRRDQNADGEAYTTETVLENVRVLAIDQTVEEKDGRMDVIGNTATLELTPGQVEALSLAQQRGSISLALRSIMDGDGNAAGEESRGMSGSVNIVKFGIPARVNAN